MRRAILAFAALIALSQTATAGVSCAVVRFYVAKYSEAVAEKWARSQGASAAEIETARRCLHPRPNVQTAGSVARSQVPAPVTSKSAPGPNQMIAIKFGRRHTSYLCRISAADQRGIVITTNHALMASFARRIPRIPRSCM